MPSEVKGNKKKKERKARERERRNNDVSRTSERALFSYLSREGVFPVTLSFCCSSSPPQACVQGTNGGRPGHPLCSQAYSPAPRPPTIRCSVFPGSRLVPFRPSQVAEGHPPADDRQHSTAGAGVGTGSVPSLPATLAGCQCQWKHRDGLCGGHACLLLLLPGTLATDNPLCPSVPGDTDARPNLSLGCSQPVTGPAEALVLGLPLLQLAAACRGGR